VGKAPRPPADPAGEPQPAEIDQRAAAPDGGDIAQMPVAERHRPVVAGQPRADHPRGVASALLGGVADARHGPAVRQRGGDGVADGEDARVTRHAEVRVHLHAPGAIRRDAEPARGRRGEHARGPDDRAGGEPRAAIFDAVRMHRGHRLAQLDFDAQFVQCPLGIGRHLGLEIGQHARPRLDQYHPRIRRPDAAEIVAQGDAGQLDDRPCQLHARRARADDDEGEQRPAPLGIGFELGLFERRQQPAPHGGGILQRLQAGREGFPVVMAEIGMLRAGGDDQPVIGNAAATRQPDRARRRVDAGHAIHQRRHVLAFVDELADRPGDLGRTQRGRRHLVEQRLEQMVVASVDERDRRTGALERLDGREPAEAAAHHHDSRRLRHGIHLCVPHPT